MTIARPRPLPPVSPRARLVGAPEALEHVPELVGGDSRPGIGDSHANLVAGFLSGDLDPSALRGVSHRVREQVRQHLPDAVRVDRDDDGRRREVQVECHALCLGDGVAACGESAQGRCEVCRLAPEDEFAGVGKRERPQVVDEVLEEQGLILERGDLGLCQRVQAVQEGLEVGLQNGERVAQLVRDVGNQPTP